MAVNGVALAAIGAGALFTYAGLTGRDIPTALRYLVLGQSPKNAPVTNPISGTAASAAGGSSGSGAAGGSSAPSAPADTRANVLLGKLMAGGYGWTGREWDALYALWERESGWDNRAQNPSSGAYGIPQALPPTKMPAAAQASGGSSPAAQITWGLAYIKARYGDPVAAWAHETSAGWY